MSARVVAVSRSQSHSFSKVNALSIRLSAGLGVEGDAHAGATVKHRSRVARDPSQPNLRQVHLVHAELFDELAALGFKLAPGAIGENLTTRGIDLLGLSPETHLRIGSDAVIEITGLRNPCSQLDRYAPGLMRATLGRDEAGQIVRKAGVMGIVVTGGDVHPGDLIVIETPSGPRRPLDVV